MKPAAAALIALLVMLAGLVNAAYGHATIVVGSLTFAPDPPGDAAQVLASIELEDPGLVEVEDAVIFLELRRTGAADAGVAAEGQDGAGAVPEENAQPQGEALHISDRLEEVGPGRYETRLPLPAAGTFTLTVRDRTYRQEEAVANVLVTFGDDPIGEIVFVLPPTATGPASLGTWLIWLIAVPLLAGIVVTVLVLKGGKSEADEAAK